MEIKLALLQLLAGNDGMPERESALLFALRIKLGGKVATADFTNTLRELEAMHYAASTRNALSNDTRWAITDAGKLALADA